jgi:hypothetical protein
MPDDITHSIVRGTNSIFVAANADFSKNQKQFDRWGIGGPFDAPRVARVEEVDTDELLLWTDMTMREDVAYTLNCTANFPSGDPPSIQNLTGKRRTSYERPRDQNLDMAASPFQDYELTADGDIALRGGFATLRKIVLDTELTPLGALFYDPEHGADQNHKGVRPVDLRTEERRRGQRIAAIPGVLEVRVFLSFSNNHLISQLHIKSEFGNINDRLDLTAGKVIL